MSEELKPCPVCGAAKGLYVLYDEHDMEWLVFCDSCKTSLQNEHNDTRDDAISTWNRRSERTCRNASPDPECFRCSECGAEDYASDSLTMWHEGGPVDICYCPVCGARIVEVSE